MGYNSNTLKLRAGYHREFECFCAADTPYDRYLPSSGSNLKRRYDIAWQAAGTFWAFPIQIMFPIYLLNLYALDYLELALPRRH